MLRGRAYHVGGSPHGGRIDGSVVVGVDGYRFCRVVRIYWPNGEPLVVGEGAHRP